MIQGERNRHDDPSQAVDLSMVESECQRGERLAASSGHGKAEGPKRFKGGPQASRSDVGANPIHFGPWCGALGSIQMRVDLFHQCRERWEASAQSTSVSVVESLGVEEMGIAKR